MGTVRTARKAALILTHWFRIVLLFLVASSAQGAGIFSEDFETGLPPDWEVENGVWEVGTPTSGPGGCFTGTQCAGTVLDDGDDPDPLVHVHAPVIFNIIAPMLFE